MSENAGDVIAWRKGATRARFRKDRAALEMEGLARIKGIGDETVKDIMRIYKNVDDLKCALIRGKVPLRNDVVEKLKVVLL